MNTADTADMADRLDAALDAVRAVRVALGGGAPMLRLPDEALDVALRVHEGYQAARRSFVSALNDVHRAGAPDETILALEAAVHHMVGQGAEVAWRLGGCGPIRQVR